VMQHTSPLVKIQNILLVDVAADSTTGSIGNSGFLRYNTIRYDTIVVG